MARRERYRRPFDKISVALALAIPLEDGRGVPVFFILKFRTMAGERTGALSDDRSMGDPRRVGRAAAFLKADIAGDGPVRVMAVPSAGASAPAESPAARRASPQAA